MMKKIKVLLSDLKSYISRRIWDGGTRSKAVYIDVDNPNMYHRFFYIFLKYFQKNDFDIYYPLSFEKYRNIKHNNQYFSWIVNEPDLVILKKAPDDAIVIQDKDISPDFFNDYFERENNETGYHFPLSFHPWIYHLNLDEVVFDFKKINSVYCFGNFDDNNYREIDEAPFEVLNRVEILKECKTFNNYQSIQSSVAMDNVLKEAVSKKLYIVEKDNYEIPIEKVREYLSQFQFYLACPGVVMPHCHNIIEAMSVNTIPILQKQYAELFYPALEHGHNALIFNSKEELRSLIETELWQYNAQEISKLQSNVKVYYQNNLQHKAVVSKVLENLHIRPIFINAEHKSVARITNK